MAADKIADVSIGITADNKTDKGAKAAEKRLSQVSGKASKSSRKALNDNERLANKSARSIIGSFSRIEQATAKALGSKSITAGLAGRVGALTEATSALGDGLAGAAASGSALGTVAGMLTTTVGALAAGVAAAAFAGYKLADGWAQSAASIGRTADVIGVGTRALQEFSAAAERAGVDKNTAAGAAAGLSQTLNDARYGRNPQALEAMRRAGISMQTNKDGTVNVDAMLPGIATAIQGQNSSGRRTLARLLGIPEGAIPAFAQGGKSLSADMADAGKTAAIASDKDIAGAQSFVRKEVRLGQLKDKATMIAGRGAAQLGEPVLDGFLKAGVSINDGANQIKVAADGFQQAVKDFKDGNVIGPLHRDDKSRPFSTIGKIKSLFSFSGGLSERIERLGEKSRQDQVSPKGAVGVMQIMPDTARSIARTAGIPFDEHRYRTDQEYNRMLGSMYISHLSKKYQGDEVLASGAYNAGEGAVDKWIKRFGDPRKGEISDADFANRIPYKETRDYVHRVVVEFRNAPKGVSATVHSGKGAVSHAMAN